jgi:hypothetical protein
MLYSFLAVFIFPAKSSLLKDFCRGFFGRCTGAPVAFLSIKAIDYKRSLSLSKPIIQRFEVGNRLIRLMAATTEDNVDNKKIIQFLESFEMQDR